MSNQLVFHERCVCGAELQTENTYDIMPSPSTARSIETWRLQHKTCLPLFHKIQEARMEQLKLPPTKKGDPMNTCKNCKHWFTDRPEDVVITGRGICRRTGRVWGMGGLTLTDEDSPAHATGTVISAFGYEMVISQLETTAEFGCNQFEEKG